MSLVLLLLSAGAGAAADFDGDGKADEFSITREATKVAKEAGVRVVNPWKTSKKAPAGFAIVVRLTKSAQKFLVHDAEFFSSPMWKEGDPAKAVKVITKKDKGYAGWKKQVKALKGDAIEVGTEAGIDILLYWDNGWELFWPDEEP